MASPLITLHRRPRGEHRSSERAATAPAARRRWSHWWALALVLGYLAQVAFRLWLSRNQLVPLANPDESAYLVEARVLAHAGAPSDFSYGTLYQGGYPLALVPIYWFTSNSVTVYHAAMAVNAVLNALLMPLAYLALRRLAVPRWLAYLGAAGAALVPEGVFYTEFAMSDAIFPVVVLAWLLTVHTWLTSRGWQASLGWGALSGLLAGYSYAVHPRGLVLIVAFGLVAVYAAVRRMVPAWAVVAAALVLGLGVEATRKLDDRIKALLYPEGPRSLSGAAWSRLTSVEEQKRILDMAGGQLWRVTTDTWGIAALGILAAVVLVFRRRVREDVRVMAALAVIVLVATVYIAPAALPDGQQANWASGRYPDAMEVTFFIAGLVVLVRVRARWLAGYAVVSAALSAGLALVVIHYAGAYQHVRGFSAFNWAEPVVLTRAVDTLSVRRATAVAIGLLALWVALALLTRWLARRLSGRWPSRWWSPGRWRAAVLVPILAMNVFALVQMTARIADAGTRDQRPNSLGLITAAGIRPGERVVLDDSLWPEWESWIPQSFEVWWTPLDMMPGPQGPKATLPAGTTVFEVAWPAGKSAQQTWPQHLPGWHVAASSSEYRWVAWHGPAAR
ncbi:MAG TPA: hypothetical protein VG268_15785 [Streptosporangiaceae bacterium]|nr:hypothetical protein [Streptosporangiaceae bacterium]